MKRSFSGSIIGKRSAFRTPPATALLSSMALQAAERQAREAEQLLRTFAAQPAAGTRAQLDRAFDAMQQTCASCHRAYRGDAAARAGSTVLN